MSGVVDLYNTFVTEYKKTPTKLKVSDSNSYTALETQLVGHQLQCWGETDRT